MYHVFIVGILLNPIMLPKTSQALCNEYSRLCSWDGSFMFPTKHGGVDLLPGIGPKGKPLLGLPMQPRIFPKHMSYMFDPDMYHGLEAADLLINHVIYNLPGSVMYRRGSKENTGSDFTTFHINCSYCCSADAKDSYNFDIGKFTKAGVRKELLKRRRSAKGIERNA